MSFAEAVAQNQAAILRMTEPEMRAILPVLQEIRDATARGLSTLLRAGEQGWSLQRRRAEYLQIDRAIKQIAHRLRDATLADLKTGSRAVGERSLRSLKRMVDAGEKQFAGAASNLSLPTAKILARADRMLINRVDEAASRYAGDVGRRVQREMIAGVIQGESPGRVARRLLSPEQVEIAERRGPTAIADVVADDLLVATSYDALRLVRTELVNAYSLTEIEGLTEADEDDPGFMKMWDATNDLRTCRDCAMLNGKVAEIHEPFPGAVWYPPLHPNDRCGIVPWHSGWGRPRPP